MSVNGTSYGGSVTQDQLTQEQASNGGLSYTSAAFDLVAGANAVIGTTAAGLGRFIPQSYAVECLTVDTLLTPAVITIGTNSPDFDNIATGITLTGITGVNFFARAAIVLGVSVAADTAIRVKLATPAGADAMTARVVISGLYPDA
jgi:hypothetical protein